MPKYSVSLTKHAIKDLDSLPEQDGDRILSAIKRLEKSVAPDGKHIKKMQGYEELYRLRVGDYRAVFKFDGVVTVVRILTRQDFGKKY